MVWTGVTTDDGMLTVEIEDSDILNPKDVTGTRSYTLKETAPAGYLAEGPWTVTLTGTERESDTTANSKFYHIYTWTVDSVTASGEQTNLLDGDVLSVLNERQTGSLMIEKVISRQPADIMLPTRRSSSLLPHPRIWTERASQRTRTA